MVVGEFVGTPTTSHEKLIAIGSCEHHGPLSTAVLVNDHPPQPSESAQVRRLTPAGSSHQEPIRDRCDIDDHFLRVASERTSVVPSRGERESHDHGERHYQLRPDVCESLQLSEYAHDSPPWRNCVYAASNPAVAVRERLRT